MKERYVIAVLSDIHANLAALEAVLEDARANRADEVIVAGDHVCDGPDARTVTDRLMALDAHLIRGNREDYLAAYRDGAVPHWEDSMQMLPVVWTYHQLSGAQLDWLTSLPEQRVIGVPGARLRIVHGSPRKNNELIFRKDTGLIREALACVDEEILVCGHNHQQYHMQMDGTLIVNPGALGLPFIEPGYVPYSLLIREDGIWHVRERKVAYNFAAHIENIRRSGLADCGPWVRAIIASLATGKLVTMAFLNHAMEFAKAQGWSGEGVIPNELFLAADKNFNWGRVE